MGLGDVRWQEIGKRLTDHIAAVRPDELAECGIAAQISTADVLEIDRCRQVIESVLPRVKPLLQGLKRPFLRANQCQMTLRPKEAAQQMMGSVLQQQIISAGLKELGLQFGSHSPRYRYQINPVAEPRAHLLQFADRGRASGIQKTNRAGFKLVDMLKDQRRERADRHRWWKSSG